VSNYFSRKIVDRREFVHELAGVYSAALTPMRNDFSPDVDAVPGLMEFLAERGCHGALLLGTTGEGPSFSFNERMEILQAAVKIKESHPHFKLLAGTGTPSLTETIDLTRAVFRLGFDGVVVLPPYYFKKVNDPGLFSWFNEVINRAVPPGGYLLGYHIPPVTGIGFSLPLMEKLKQAHPEKFAGIKDSSADAGYARTLGDHFGSELLVFTGNDGLFELALENHAAGCITALANLYSPILRKLWDEFQEKGSSTWLQAHIKVLRSILDSYAPFPPILKSLLAQLYRFPLWSVRPPLMPVSEQVSRRAAKEFSEAAAKV
jgi:4-hydroxy-tetrahydrodipicolinate synthase